MTDDMRRIVGEQRLGFYATVSEGDGSVTEEEVAARFPARLTKES